MVRPLRIQYTGAWYHVMNRGRRREKVFLKKKDYREFLRIVREASKMFHVHVTAYCLMPNHYHLQIQTPDANISRFMRHVDGVYTQLFNRRHGLDGQLFRGRYKSIVIGGDSYRLEVFRYIHWNPQKAGLEAHLSLYRWSSYQAYFSRSGGTEWISRDLILNHFQGPEKKQLTAMELFLDHEPPEEVDLWYKQKRTFPAFGDNSFITWLKKTFFTAGVESEKPQSRFLAPDISLIKKEVAEYYAVPSATLLKVRRGITNEPRDMAVYLSRHLRGDTLVEIGRHFNFSNYSSVSSALQRVTVRMHKKSTKRQYNQIVTSLQTFNKKGQK